MGLSDDQAIYNNQDVQELVDQYHAQIVGSIREAVEEIINHSAVYLSQLLAQEEQMGIVTEPIDISSIEDHHRMSEIAAMATTGMAPPPAPAKKNIALPTLQAGSADPQMIAKMQEIEEENRQMRDRYQQMQAEVSRLAAERSSVASELEQTKSHYAHAVLQLQQTSPDASSNAHLENALMQTKTMLEEKSRECEQMRVDMSQRLGDSNQFKELKGIVKKKTAEVKALRNRLMENGLPYTTDTGGVELVAED